MLTISPGDELYMGFGHSAVRVVDPQNRLDRIYNYGTFSFDEPGFYIKFCRGQLDYQLSAYDYKYAYLMYTREERSMKEQVFRMTPQMKQTVYEALETNHLKENRRYRYDFFFDNCATRIRDIFESALGESFKIYESNDRDLTFRNYIDQYLVPMQWADFGIDLVLGAKTDYRASAREAMFLPDYLFEGFDKATIKIDGQIQPFVKEHKQILTYPEQEMPGVNTPFIVMLGVLVVAGLVTFITGKDDRFVSLATIFDALLFGIIGLLGVIILLLWFATDHKVTPANYNILWIWPTHFGVLLFMFRRNAPDWLAKYFKVYLALLGIVLVGWFLIPQQFHVAFIPLILALGLRSWERQ
ncbi:MAG: DUF4105 domain-containing protein [Calditrichota bacterium]